MDSSGSEDELDNDDESDESCWIENCQLVDEIERKRSLDSNEADDSGLAWNHMLLHLVKIRMVLYLNQKC